MPFPISKFFAQLRADLPSPAQVLPRASHFLPNAMLTEEPDSILNISPSVTFCIETSPHAPRPPSAPLRRASEFPSPCRRQSELALEKLFSTILAGDFDVAAEQVTSDPHLLYCWRGGHTALSNAIDAESPVAPLFLARTLANQDSAGVSKLKAVLRDAIAACRASRHCTLLASVFQALLMAFGDTWMEHLLPRAGDPSPVATTRRRLDAVAAHELGADVDRADVQDFLQHGVADLVMIALSRRMAVYDPALAIGFDLFNRDERVLMALQHNAAALESRAAQDGNVDQALVQLLGEIRTVVGAMTQRCSPQRRASIQESVGNLASLLDG